MGVPWDHTRCLFRPGIIFCFVWGRRLGLMPEGEGLKEEVPGRAEAKVGRGQEVES